MTTSCLLVLIALVGAEPTEPSSGLFESPASLAPECRIDELVFARLKQLEVQPARVCSDEVFVRRVYLDVLGTLPTAQEARDFLRDSASDKRRVLIDRLLERDEFAD